MRIPLILLLGLGLGLAHGPAHTHGAHQHGVAHLLLAVDGDTLSIRLESPLDNLLGFERAPRDARERAAADALLARLQGAHDLFIPTQAAGCSLTSAKVEAPVLQGRAAAGGHADLIAEWRYGCRAPEKLSGLRVLLFRHFQRLTRLEAVVAGPRGQRAPRLGPRMPDLTW